MPTERQIDENDPMWIAWVNYSQTKEYYISRSWAATEHPHVALWTAFAAGFMAGKGNK